MNRENSFGPKITVILPSYNIAPYIHKCMDSVLEQTLQEIEVLAVDADSTDGTHEILEEYAERDPRVTLLRDIKKSTGYAKNLGIDMARAPYIAIVEPDDYIAPEMMETLYKKAQTQRADIVKADYCSFLEMDGEEWIFPKSVSSDSSDYNRSWIPRRDKKCFAWVKNEWLGIYRKEFLNRNGIRHNESKGAAFQDIGFWFLSFAFAEEVILIRDKCYYYRKDNPYASMYDRSKAFDTDNEYAYIAQSLRRHPELFAGIEDAYVRAYFADNRSVFARVSEEYHESLACQMRNFLLIAEKDGKLNPALYQSDEWEDIQILLSSEEEFCRKKQKEFHLRERNLEILLEKLKDAGQIIIFCAGSYGSNLAYILSLNGIRVTAFADNAEEKHGKYLNGYLIRTLSECMEIYQDAIYLIAHKYKGHEIAAEIKKEGISEARIIVCQLEEITDVLL